MTEEEMRIAIAEACGYLRPHFTPSGSCQANTHRKDDGAYWGTCGVPDYLNDLNAMHEAEKVLDRNQKNRYLNILHRICLPEDYDELDDDFGWCTATASQRAEAFLKALNLWTE